MVSTVTGAQEGAEIKLEDTLHDSAHGVRWAPDGGRSLAAVDIRSGTPNLWSGILGDGPAKQLTQCSMPDTLPKSLQSTYSFRGMDLTLLLRA